MLYDPKWGTETKVDPCDFKAFVAWIEAQPSEKSYDWCGCCLVEQYMAHLGLRPYSCYTTRQNGKTIYSHLTPGALAATAPHTFGAALERGRAAAAGK